MTESWYDPQGEEKINLAAAEAAAETDAAAAEAARLLALKQAAITAPNTQTSSYVQADVQSIVTTVNAIRAALTAYGVTL